MKKNILYLYLLTVSLTSSLQAQDIIQVPHEKAVDVSWQGDEKQYFSQNF